MVASRYNTLLFPTESQIVIRDESSTTMVRQKRNYAIPFTIFVNYGGKAQEPPPLTFYINPESMEVSNTKKVNNDFARGGNIIEEWGDMQEVISFSGRSGGFYVVNPEKGLRGLNRYDHTKSFAFQNLFSLFMLYQNNGAIYEKSVSPDIKSFSEKKLVKNTTKRIDFQNRKANFNTEKRKNYIYTLGDVSIYYDRVLYTGAFDDFRFSENSQSQYFFSYSFTFTVQNKEEYDQRNFSRFTNNTNQDFFQRINRIESNVVGGANDNNTNNTQNLSGNSGFGNTPTTQSSSSDAINLQRNIERTRVYQDINNISNNTAVTRGNIATKAAIDYTGYLQTEENLVTTEENFANIQVAYNNFGSSVFSLRQLGQNQINEETTNILINNNFNNNINKKSSELTEVAKSIYDTKKRLIS